MKNFTLGLNIVLVLAVGTLFYLHFSSNKKSSAVEPKQVVAGNFKIAYFEMDSIENKFEYWRDAREELKKSDQAKASEVNQRRNEHKALFIKYQQQQQSGRMTKEEIERANETLMQSENSLKEFEQAKNQEMQNESVTKMQIFKKKIEDFLKDYNKEKTYSYIFSNTPEMIYFKDTVYNITNDLLKGLNDQYKKKK